MEPFLEGLASDLAKVQGLSLGGMSDFFLSLMLLGALSSSGSLPYWATAGQYGLMPESSGTLAWVRAGQTFDTGKDFRWGWGAGLAANDYRDELDPASSSLHPMVDELYVRLRWKALTLDLGQKRRALDFLASDPVLGSLSVTGGHLSESGNARPMPGYLISLDPVAIPLTDRHLWFYGAFGDYKTLDRRYVPGALVHRTQVGLRGDIGSRLSFHFALDHFAMWGGTHPDHASMPVNLENYFRVVTGRPAGADGEMTDRLNVIGDQRGAELIRAEWRADGWTAVAQHDIPYDDGSGMGFQNFPDGVNTLYFGWDDKDRWISDIVFEYHYTRYQSGPVNVECYGGEDSPYAPGVRKTTGLDNYFNNGEYRSGWTHFGRTIGEPLFFPAGTHAGTWSPALVTLGVENNRIRAHHLGLGGKLFRMHPYRLMLTYTRNYGTYAVPYAGQSAWQRPWGSVSETPLRQFSASFTGFWEQPFGVRGLSGVYGVFTDAGEVLPSSFGAMLGVRYSLESKRKDR